MVALRGSLGHENWGLTSSSMERHLNSDLFPACSDQQGMRPVVRTGTVPFTHSGLDAHGSEFCMAPAIMSLFSPDPAFLHLTFCIHSDLVWFLPLHPVLPLHIGSSSLMVPLVYKALSPKETRVVPPFSGSFSLEQQTFYSSSYISVADDNHSGLGAAILASSVVCFICLPK